MWDVTGRGVWKLSILSHDVVWKLCTLARTWEIHGNCTIRIRREMKICLTFLEKSTWENGVSFWTKLRYYVVGRYYKTICWLVNSRCWSGSPLLEQMESKTSSCGWNWALHEGSFNWDYPLRTFTSPYQTLQWAYFFPNETCNSCSEGNVPD